MTISSKRLNMEATWYILILLTLSGYSMEVDAVEIPQVWIKYIRELLRKYEASVASEYIIHYYNINITTNAYTYR